MAVKSVLLALMGVLAPLAVASPCKPSVTTSVTSAEVTTSDTTYTQATSTAAEAVTTTKAVTTTEAVTTTKAGTTTEAVTTTEATTTTETTPASTTRAAAGPVCGVEGFAKSAQYSLEEVASLEVCRRRCRADSACKTFLLDGDLCYRYTSTVEELVRPGSSNLFFYDFNCPPTEEDPQ